MLDIKKKNEEEQTKRQEMNALLAGKEEEVQRLQDTLKKYVEEKTIMQRQMKAIEENMTYVEPPQTEEKVDHKRNLSQNTSEEDKKKPRKEELIKGDYQWEPCEKAPQVNELIWINNSLNEPQEVSVVKRKK